MENAERALFYYAALFVVFVAGICIGCISQSVCLGAPSSSATHTEQYREPRNQPSTLTTDSTARMAFEALQQQRRQMYKQC